MNNNFVSNAGSVLFLDGLFWFLLSVLVKDVVMSLCLVGYF